MLHKFLVVFRDRCRFGTKTVRDACGLEVCECRASADKIYQISAGARRV